MFKRLLLKITYWFAKYFEHLLIRNSEESFLSTSNSSFQAFIGVPILLIAPFCLHLSLMASVNSVMTNVWKYELLRIF